MTFAIILGGFDLSVGSVTALVARRRRRNPGNESI